MQSKKLDELKLTGALPSPSGVGLKILSLTQDEDYAIGDLTETIQLDPALTGRITQACDRAAEAGGSAAEMAALLRPRVTRLIEVTTALAEVGATDPEAFLADATEYLEAAGHVVIAWIWVEQVMALGARTGDEDDAFAAGKLRAAEYFLRRELPIVDAKFDLLAAGDRTTLDMRDDWF